MAPELTRFTTPEERKNIVGVTLAERLKVPTGGTDALGQGLIKV